MKEKFSSDSIAIPYLRHLKKSTSGNQYAMMSVFVYEYENEDCPDQETYKETIMRALLNDYEIEEENYKVILPHRDGYGSRLALAKYGVNTPEFEELDKLSDAQKFTLAEIEAINPNYVPFARKVEE